MENFRLLILYILVVITAFVIAGLFSQINHSTEDKHTDLPVGAPPKKYDADYLEIMTLEGDTKTEKKVQRVFEKLDTLPGTWPKTYVDNDLTYEVHSISQIPKGVEIYARVWYNGKQLGFGENGSIDIERFRIINPPTLVENPRGNIEMYTHERDDNFNIISTTTTTYSYDPLQAFTQAMRRIVLMVGKDGGNIEPGKIGQTTTTAYAEAGDGGVLAFGGGSASAANWNTIHDATSGGLAGYTEALNDAYAARLRHIATTNGTQIGRMFLPFDTSAISASDTIDSATLEVYSRTVELGGTHTLYVNVVEGFQPSETALTTADYDTAGDAVDNPTEGATRLSFTTNETDYTTSDTFTLNATGLGWVKKSGQTASCGSTAGYTCLSIRTGADMDDTAPAAGTEWRYAITFSEQAGTASDPLLTVTHSAGTAEVPEVRVAPLF